MPNRGVAIFDLEKNVKTWMGISTGVLNGTYISKVDVTLRVFPDENKDTIRRRVECDVQGCGL